jgi:hypothetical protein
MTEKKKHTYQSDMLLPPLRMVLVHAEKDSRNAVPKTVQEPKARLQNAGIGQEDLIKLIEHLKKKA